MSLGGARRSSRALHSLDATLRPPRRAARDGRGARRALQAQAEGSCCQGALRTGRFFGDVNGDCVFDVKDVRRASLLPPPSPPALPPACNPRYPNLQP